ncbi:SH3 domain-containing protein [Fusarium falciforme]|uniref:SH3 domain-containing protein n=1 Tax=Fusarium falciforme TaxID=195108 RepID=UPI0023011371|nr:SH3 domain-containing protein [Fusarium falciforme]WAO85547.1 SH3 domain-containing protein [Fusarium falciforme]
MHARHARVHRRADGLFGFGNIAHEIQGSDTKKRHVEKREPQVIKTVFKTLEPTFEGEVGGYKTVGDEPEPTKAQNRAPVITHNAQKEADRDEDEDDEDQTEKQKEAAEKKKEQEEAKEKAAEEAAEKKAAQEEAAKEKAAEEAAEKKKAQEEAKEKAAEESAKEKAAEEAKTRNKSKDEDDGDETATEKATTTKPTRTRVLTTSENHSSVPTVISEPTESSIESVLAKATGDVSGTAAVGAAEDISGSSTISSSSATAEASTSGGTSAGAKAGIAFGVLGGLLAVALIVFFIFNRRRKQAEMQRLENDDEKLNGPIGGGMGGMTGPMRSVTPEAPDVVETASVRTDAKAPRVSLRPVTQFLPNWNGLDNQKRTSKGAAMALAVPASTSAAAAGPLSPRTPGGSAWERPSTAQSTDPANPFGHQAERVPSPVQEESIQSRGAPSPIPEHSTPVAAASAGSVSPQSPSSPVNDPLTANGPPISVGAPAGAAAAAGAGAGVLARKTSMRNNGPPQLDLTIPPGPNHSLAAIPASPAGTEFSTASAAPGTPDGSSGAAAIAAAGGPANSAVHRVQLDFKPTLDDELELKAGDLVRLLHEYDDGWALCIRLDRSRQGVVPRTCLSTRPVKPRPAQAGPRPGPPVKPVGAPRGPGPNHPQGQRPMTPQGNFGPGRPASPAGRPMTPNGTRPQSPMGPPMGPHGRPAGPMSPGPRTQSPGPFQGPPGPRSQSPGPRQGPPNRAMSPGPRSQSPGPAGGRSQSPSGMNRRNSPPGPSPMNPSQAPRPAPSTGSVNRKPVPGQAY